MTWWLLEDSVFRCLDAAMAQRAMPDQKAQAEYEASILASSDDTRSRIMATHKGVATIAIRGVLTNAPNLFASWFGGGNTTYSEIINAVRLAEGDPSISEIEYDIDSPGGQASALWFSAMAAIGAATKPSRAIVTGMAASAAYGLAAQADKIEAVNRMVSVGSVGVVAQYMVSEQVVTVTSTEAPDKRPDMKTEAGRATVRKELDAIHAEFAASIAEGRGVDVETVNSKFGRGAVVLATEAKERGMIDSIAGPVLSIASSGKDASDKQPISQVQEHPKMDMNKLKAEHPELFEAVRQSGIQAERDRVTAHLKLGQSSGAMETALKAIADGTEMNATIQADYMAAHMNKTDQERRASDEEALRLAGGRQPGNGAPGNGASEDDEVVALVEQKLGINAE